MGLESDNRDGYRNGSLTEKALGLRNKTYYLVHGTGDDNVHFQMSMELARQLELADIDFEQMVCAMSSVHTLYRTTKQPNFNLFLDVPG